MHTAFISAKYSKSRMMVNMAIPPFSDARTMYKLQQFNFKKEQTILIPVKHNHACTKEINPMPSRQFSEISKFQNFFVKNKKKSIIMV